MPDCAVCIGGGDYDGAAEFYNVTTPKARKPHTCCECRRAIQQGQRYEKHAYKFYGDFQTDRTCLVCAEIRRVFTCGGTYTIGELWSDLCDYVFPQMTTGCLERLETAAAKAYLLERWRAWKFADVSESRGEQ